MAGYACDLNGIKAVVLDMDGTVIHTTVDFTKMKIRMVEELSAKGVPVSILDPKDTIVNNLKRVREYMVESGRWGELAGIEERVASMMDQTEMELVSNTIAVEGARETIERLRERGYLVGLLTRGSRRYATAALHYAGLEGLFDAQIFRDDYPEHEAKPNALALRRMAERLGVRVEECLMVGDHLMDMECALSTSAPFAGVLTGSYKKEDWATKGCPCVVNSVKDVTALLGAD